MRKMIEKMIFVVYEISNITLVKKYKDGTLESNTLDINKLSSIIGTIKNNKIPVFLFFANNNEHQQLYFSENLPVVSYLNLQMLLKKRMEIKIGSYDLKEVINVKKEKQQYLFIAANIDKFWKNFIKMTSDQFIGISFLALEAQSIIQLLSKGKMLILQNRLQLLIFYEQKNQIQYLILFDNVIYRTKFIKVHGLSDKIIEGYIIQHLNDIHDEFKNYTKDAYIIVNDTIRQSLGRYQNINFANIAVITPLELGIVTNTEQLIGDVSNKFASLCFLSNILHRKSNMVFNIVAHKKTIQHKKQNTFLNVSSFVMLIVLCFSSIFFYFKISKDSTAHYNLVMSEQRLQAEFKEVKDMLLYHDEKNKEKILIYKFLNANDTSPLEKIYDLKKTMGAQSLEWSSSDIHVDHNNITVKVSDNSLMSNEVMHNILADKFSDYHLTTTRDNNSIEIKLTHK